MMEQRQKQIEFDLFFDESGVFKEPPVIGETRLQSPQGSSQIVGILASSGTFTESISRKILTNAFQGIGEPLPREIHANTINHKDFQIIMEAMLKEMQEQPWSMVRIVNEEGLGFGESAETYYHMISELVIRIFNRLSQNNKGRIAINIIAARRMENDQQDGILKSMKKENYTKTINEYLSFAFVQKGFAASSRNWFIPRFNLESARRWPPLQVCDLLSNASFRNYKRCSLPVKNMIASLVG
jgi:hypothetical protein